MYPVYKFLTLLLVKYIHQTKSPVLMVLNNIVNINVQGENRVLFSEQNYFLYRAYTINKYSPVLIKNKQTKHHSLASICMKMLRNSQDSNDKTF